MRRWVQWWLVAVVAFAPHCVLAQGLDIEKPRNVILFGWDGAQRGHVQECLERGELPTLKRLATEGVMIDDKTLVYVTPDHGFNEGQKGHSKAPHIFLATNDKRLQKGLAPATRTDIPVTIMSRFGLDLAKLQLPMAGRVLTK
ncbi:MAG: hypothetical protein FJ291_21545 [Planctomycetes bacterium]|nr:hypothetical protein [Planctomycetota bacterium]